MTAQPRAAETNENTPMVGEKVVNLALQGSGSHGAFIWGVLDRLLEDGRLAFDGVTATSAGAVNAVLLADGLARGGREGARTQMRSFWTTMSEAAAKSPIAPSFIDQASPTFGLEHTPGYLWNEMLTRMMSPYELNPSDVNPLRDLFNATIDFERVRRQKLVKLFLCATNVRTSKVKAFPREELTAEHVLASSCIPIKMRTPEIDGEYYWDGGFMGNPAIFPVIYNCDSRDVVMVHLTPFERPEIPTNARSILDRMQEIIFNSSLMREMRAIAFVTKLIDEGKITDGKRMYMHLIDAEDVIRPLSGSSTANGTWRLLSHLFEIGRERADKWLDAHYGQLGKETTVDMQEKYL
jgi:NTE family protein